MIEPLMTANEACAYLRISKRSLANHERHNLLPVHRVGRLRRYRRAEIDKWAFARMTGIAG